MPIFRKEKKQILMEPASIMLSGKKLKGSLFRSNQRLIFEAVSGVFSKKTEEISVYPLSDIRHVEAEELISKKLFLQVGTDLKKGSMEVAVPNP